jgi:hypothetical protein
MPSGVGIRKMAIDTVTSTGSNQPGRELSASSSWGISCAIHSNLLRKSVFNLTSADIRLMIIKLVARIRSFSGHIAVNAIARMIYGIDIKTFKSLAFASP